MASGRRGTPESGAERDGLDAAIENTADVDLEGDAAVSSDSAWLTSTLRPSAVNRGPTSDEASGAPFLRDALLNAPVAICVLRGETHALALANASFVRLFGRAVPSDASFAALFPDLEAEGLLALLDDTYENGVETNASELHVRCERGDIFVNLACAPTGERTSGERGVIVTASDVTESVRARLNVERLADMVQSGEARLRQMLRAADAGTWELDLYTGREQTDERFRELVGLGRLDELPPDLGAVHPDDRARVRAAEARALDRLEALLVEFRPAADPSRWIELRGEMVHGPGKRQARLTAIAVDVTPRKQAEEARAELLRVASEAKRALERVGETMPQQVWTATPDGMLDFVNARAVAFFGARGEDLLGAKWTVYVHPDDRGPATERWGAALASGEGYETEFRLLATDGSYRWHLSRAVPLRDPTGAILKWIGTNTEIDELKRAREELERRTSYEQHLIGIVSHDLRAPLHSIGLASELLATSDGLAPPAVRAVKTLQGSARRASRLVNDILDFTRARLSGGIPIERRSAHLASILEPVLHEARDAFPKRRVTLEVEGQLDGLWDSDRVSQVVQNALTNALRYSPPASIVHVRATGTEHEVEVEVQNSGPPIPAHVLANVFQPMTRGEDDARSHQGVGLGLFIVREIVSAHGGVVRLTSSEVDGTRLTVRLPRGARGVAT